MVVIVTSVCLQVYGPAAVTELAGVGVKGNSRGSQEVIIRRLFPSRKERSRTSSTKTVKEEKRTGAGLCAALEASRRAGIESSKVNCSPQEN